VTVRLGQPEQEPTGEWACPVDIQGIPQAGIEYARGIDAVQALQLAMTAARQRLDASGLSLSWSQMEPGETGFPAFVPYSFGLFFSRKIERYIEQEIDWLGEAVREHQARKP
jgi:hypothetical protein